ncbi:MAG: DUF3078 domain-containing protein [Rikenellaceae bacterium]
MNRKLQLILPLITIFLLSISSYAQFNISNKIEKNSLNISKIDTLEKKELSLMVMNDAYQENLKKMLRKSRNSFESENSLYFTQFGYSNWVSSGDNTFNGRVTTATKHIYTTGDEFNITTKLDGAYALGYQDSMLWKTEDWFTLNSAVNYQMSNRFYYTLNTTLKSQFSDSYASKTDSVISSTFFAPATLTLGLGINYSVDKNRAITLSPISGNMVMVFDETLSELGEGGVEAGKKVALNFGASLDCDWKQSIIKDTKKINGGADILSFRTTIQSFWDYKNMPNLDWQSWLDLSIYQYFSVSFNVQLKFDDTVATPNNRPWQFSEVLGVGVKYKFTKK